MDLIRKISGLFLFSICLFFFFGLSSCKSGKNIASRKSPLEHKFYKSSLFKEAFTGFILYDPASKTELINYNGLKYFTPASNAKIATLLSAIEILQDSIPFIQYQKVGDTLYFSGTGDPCNLNPYFQDNQHLLNWLSFRPETLIYKSMRNNPDRYGSGWAWDDNKYYYQLENNAFPVFGNQIHINVLDSTLSVLPEILKAEISFEYRDKQDLIKPEYANNIQLFSNGRDFDRIVPMHVSDSLMVRLMSDTLKKSINFFTGSASNFLGTSVRRTMPDSLLIRMMQESDNFIAEQVLIMCSFELSDSLNRNIAIDNRLTAWNAFIPKKIRWVDGSGLSRYNLFTPVSIVKMLERIRTIKGDAWVSEVFAQGRVSGTIRSAYGPYVYAKTGTLSNNHNLSGYIQCQSGKTFIFSFMHNHFMGSASKYQMEMSSMLEWIHKHY